MWPVCLAESFEPRFVRKVVLVTGLLLLTNLIQCDGDRPTCLPCAKRHETCEYDVAANTTRSNALKRKNEDLSAENKVLRELYSFLRQRPLVEAEEIFRRIRNTDDPLEVHRHVVTAEYLLMDQMCSRPSSSRSSPQGFNHSTSQR